MSDDFCIHNKCGREVESIYIYVILQGYETLKGYSYCGNCKEIVKDTDTHWKHIEYRGRDIDG